LANQLVAISRGDQRAPERFYDATLSRVFAVARRPCTDDALAEEGTEDVYVQVWRDAGRFAATRGTGVAADVGALARTRRTPACRYREQRRGSAQPSRGRGAAVAGTGSFNLLDALRRDSEVRSALATLPARDRQMVALAFLRGLTHAQIAAAMQLPLGTEKTTIRRALGLMRMQLSAHGPGRTNEETGDEDHE
jgi:RNA polymerase sigma-70 factor, ECF subfamily